MVHKIYNIHNINNNLSLQTVINLRCLSRGTLFDKWVMSTDGLSKKGGATTITGEAKYSSYISKL